MRTKFMTEQEIQIKTRNWNKRDRAELALKAAKMQWLTDKDKHVALGLEEWLDYPSEEAEIRGNVNMVVHYVAKTAFQACITSKENNTEIRNYINQMNGVK
jgi:hypothetical protein